MQALIRTDDRTYTCPRRGFEDDSFGDYCPECDTAYTMFEEEGEFFCLECGHALDEDDKKCWYCKAKLTC